MRISFPRTAAVCCGLVLVVTGAATGCGSDDEKSDTAATTSTSAKAATSAKVTTTTSAATPADPATTAAVSEAYTSFFDATAPVDQRVAKLEKADAFLPVLSSQAPQNTSVTVSAVKLLDPTHAEVTYTLLLGGNPMLNNQTGTAVQEAGQWKVSATTFCSLLTLQGATASVC